MKDISTNLTNIKLESFYKTKIQDLFNSNSIDYVFEKNTIIILDQHWTNDQIKEMKEYLKSNDLNIISLDKYTEMK
jgi:transposase